MDNKFYKGEYLIKPVFDEEYCEIMVLGEKGAVETFIRLFNDEKFWESVDSEGEIDWEYSNIITNTKWVSLIISEYTGCLDGDSYEYFPFKAKYKARWNSPLLRLNKDIRYFCPIPNHPFKLYDDKEEITF